MATNSCRVSFLVAVVILNILPSAWAQSTPNDVTPGNETGTMSYQTYGGAHENVSLSNGNLNLQIPLINLPSRNGQNLSLGLTYDSKIWTLHQDYDPYSGIYTYWWDYPSVGVGFNFPGLESTWTAVQTTRAGTYWCNAGYIVRTSDGSKHSFGNRTGCWYYPNTGNPSSYPADNINVTDAADASYLRLDSTNSADIVLHTKSGEQIHFTGSQNQFSKLEDSNGNTITYSQVNSNLWVVKDNLGRSINFNYSSYVLQNISYLDANGVNRTISFSYTPVTIYPTFTNPPGSYDGDGSQLWSPISSVTLPNNLKWTFQYDTWGGLTKITYPAGGYTRYDYVVDTNLWVSHRAFSAAADFREVNHRYVCRSATGSCATEDVTTYAATVNGTIVNNQYMDLTDALGNRTRYQFSAPAGGTPVYSAREIFRYYYQGQSTLLRTVQTDYNSLDYTGNPTDNSLPIRVTTTLNDVSPNIINKKEWDYDTYSQIWCSPYIVACSGVGAPVPIDNPTEERDFDWGSGGPGTLMRKTDYTWLKTNAVNGQDYTTTAIHILNRKLTEQIKDINSTIFAQTQYEYDNYASDQKHAALQSSGAVQHDAAFSTSYTTRGNVTAIQHWRNTDSVWLTTYNQLDDSGNIRKTIDPAGNPTSFGFADSWGNATCTPSGGNAAAYPTTVTNALNQSISSTYNSCNGTTATSTDLNNQPSTFGYDLMGRRVQSTFPDGGQSSGTYNESSLPLNITASKKITSSINLSSYQGVDGIGHTTQTQMTSDPQGTDYVDTTYDALERKSTISNSYRSTGDPTYGITTSVYDALGRVIQMIPPDGSGSSNNVSTAYSGNCSTVSDQTGRKRKSCMDGLGRTKQVFEPDVNGNLVNETDYQYDVLNNLLCVHQRGTDTTADKSCTDPTVPASWRPRSFTYNSLSQLLTANNPESGSIAYAYDADGNVLTKTDARGIVTSYFYDAVNRLTKKTYSDSTPQITYWYDGQTPTGCTPPTLSATYGIGRRTAMCDAGGSEAWSYDQMGRIQIEKRTTNGITKTTTYTYNLDGSLATLTYPSGRVVTFTPSGAGRELSAVDLGNGITYASGALYTPFGALSGVQYGSNLISTLYYNTRLQPCRISVQTSGTQPSQCSDSLNTGNLLDLSYDYNMSVANNGNVKQITNNRNANRTQAFTYDSMNRIQTAITQGTSGSLCWGIDYSYDVYANLLSASLDSSRPSCSWTVLNAGVDTHNRITNTGFSYDAAGNVLSDATTSYSWDAESELKTAAGLTYTYDGDGRRVQKSNGKLYWYGSGDEILDESDASGNITDEFVFFGGKRIARRNVSSGNIYYYLADNLGTARMIVQAGQTTPCYDADFDPFGGEHVAVNTCPQNYKFTGKERDAETGLDDFDARYYSSGFGRFQSSDWSAIPAPVPYADLGNPQTLNLYAYVKNNPMNLTDPAGHGNGPPEGPTGAMFYVIGGGGEGGPGAMTYTVTVNGESTTFSDLNEAQAFYNQTVKQAQNQVVMNVAIFRSDNLSNIAQGWVNSQIAQLTSDMSEMGINVNVVSDLDD